jgi:hypothetical protein
MFMADGLSAQVICSEFLAISLLCRCVTNVARIESVNAN